MSSSNCQQTFSNGYFGVLDCHRTRHSLASLLSPKTERRKKEDNGASVHVRVVGSVCACACCVILRTFFTSPLRANPERICQLPSLQLRTTISRALHRKLDELMSWRNACMHSTPRIVIARTISQKQFQFSFKANSRQSSFKASSTGIPLMRKCSGAQIYLSIGLTSSPSSRFSRFPF